MLSYCTNIHPAESWAETREALFTCVPRIRQELAAMNSPLKNLPLGIGLRLSARAAAELLETPHAVEALKSWLDDQGARVETLNGFPYGNFHGQRVKERVFQPDWTTPERFEYTCNLFRILALIGDEQADRLTVSTLPASHSWFHADEERLFSRLDAMSGFLDMLGRQTGRLMQLGLEPEPFGHFHDTEGAIRFFNGLRNYSRRPELIERHLGLTYDTCHFAILREEPEATLSAWEENNIALCKVQYSNALECRVRGEEDLERLRQFDEGVYFHQTSIRNQDRTMLFPDLPNALAYGRDYAEETRDSQWRIHYHIPLYASPEPPLKGTEEFILKTRHFLRDRQGPQPHL
ncbi:metabolite traffic protein EboE, partial [uncultured Akkermansia sp.]